MQTTVNLDEKKLLSEAGQAERIAYQILRRLPGEITDARVAKILDTYEWVGEDVGPTYNTARNKFIGGAAVVSGGEGPVYMEHSFDEFKFIPYCTLTDGKILSGPSQGVTRLLFGWMIPKEPYQPGELLAESRPEGIIVRTQDPNLVEICKDVADCFERPLHIRA